MAITLNLKNGIEFSSVYVPNKYTGGRYTTGKYMVNALNKITATMRKLLTFALAAMSSGLATREFALQPLPIHNHSSTLLQKRVKNCLPTAERQRKLGISAIFPLFFLLVMK